METVQVAFHRADGVMLAAAEMAAGVRYEMDVPEGTARMSLTWPVVPAPSVEPPSRENLPAFRAHVLRWLREEQGVKAVSVEQVSGYGTDWEGSTESGFYSTTSIEINYTAEDGKQRFKDVTGEDFMSLWHWVVDVWPEPVQASADGEITP
jgi:hypothetical protein